MIAAAQEPTVLEQVAVLIEDYARQISECAEDAEYQPLINRTMLAELLDAAYHAPKRGKLSDLEDDVMINRGSIQTWIDNADDPRYPACTMFKPIFLSIRAKKNRNLNKIMVSHAHEDPNYALTLLKQTDAKVYGTQVIEKHEIKEAKITIHTIHEARMSIEQSAEKLRLAGFYPDGSRISAEGTCTVDGRVLQSGSGESSSYIPSAPEATDIP